MFSELGGTAKELPLAIGLTMGFNRDRVVIGSEEVTIGGKGDLPALEELPSSSTQENFERRTVYLDDIILWR